MRDLRKLSDFEDFFPGTLMRFTTHHDPCSGLHLSLCTGLTWRQEVMGVGWGQR